MDRPVKQVLVIRKDLKMRRGKEIAQGAHASMKWLAEHLKKDIADNVLTEEQAIWLNGSFTKVCLQVNSEDELVYLHERASIVCRLTSHLITDSGLTEFNGVPTITCCAIGPNWSDEIDLITKNLKLY